MTPERWQMVRGILQSAMQLRPAERGLFLDRECAADPALRKEVEKYLSVEGKLQPEFLESPAAYQVGAASTTASGKTLLAAGTRLGPYEVQALLGAGGMGEVYRACDTRLNRTVAIKVIPRSFSTDPARLQRFEREARAIAALQHPNICTLHDIGHQDGIQYLVMEYLDGQTLARRLQKGRLPLEQTLRYGAEIADALDAAHRRRIVHRDLKPANIFLTTHGEAKVLDFGLAKLDQPELEQDTSVETARVENPLTTPGVAMGTASYMSPEQARGEELDGRTDLFSLGAVMYEMATGKMAFPGKTIAIVHKAILDLTPSAPSQVIPTLSNRFDDVIGKALEKDRDLRYQSAGDLRADINRVRRALESNKTGAAKPSGQVLSKTRWVRVWFTGIVVLLLFASGIWYFHRPLPPPRITGYMQITHDGRRKFIGGTDGNRLYFNEMAGPAGPASVVQVAVSGGLIQQLALPSLMIADVSPDGANLLAMSLPVGDSPENPLWNVRILGGSMRRLGDAADASFSPDGNSVAFCKWKDEIWLVQSDGTGARRLATVKGTMRSIAWSPDGRAIRVIREGELWEISSSGSNPHKLLAGWHAPTDICCGRWTHDGKLFIFLAGGQIWALDERRGLFRQPPHMPVQLTEGPIRWDRPIPSNDGTRIFARGHLLRGELSRFDSKSRQFQPFLGGISAQEVAFSKDGKSVAYVSYPDNLLWKADRDGSHPVQLTDLPLQALLPRWSPDGANILFAGWASRIDTLSGMDTLQCHIYLVPSEGGSPPRPIPEISDLHTRHANWSPDGRKIVYNAGSDLSVYHDLRLLDFDSHKVTILSDSPDIWGARWSPDGRYLAAAMGAGSESGLNIFDFKTQKWSELPQDGLVDSPEWSQDSKFIYFRRPRGDMGVFRISINGGSPEKVVDLTDWHDAGFDGKYMGLDPTDSPLLLRDIGSDEIYALTLEP